MSYNTYCIIAAEKAPGTYDFVANAVNNEWLPLSQIWATRSLDDAYWSVVENPVQGMGGFMVGRVVAMGFVRGWGDKWEHKFLGLVVDKERQGLGLGQLMLQIAYFTAKQRGEKAMYVHVNQENEFAYNLYADFGFSIAGWPQGNEEITMRKEL